MTVNVYKGDCLKVLEKSMPNYYDSLICDPPYGLGFMGKDWDHGIPGVVFWKEFLRVCKPGAFALVFGGTRTHHRLMCAMEDAGWEIRDCMMWLYGSGFPKSHNIGKTIGKLRGNERIPYERPDFVVRSNKKPQRKSQVICGEKGKYTKGLSEWEGYGTALKPAWEPIIVAMKPLDGTFAHNAEKWGVGGLWIDGGRIVHNEPVKTTTRTAKRTGTALHLNTGKSESWQEGTTASANPQGRWPANVILDEEAGVMLDGQSGTLQSGKLLTHHKRKGNAPIGTFQIRDRTGEPCNFGGDSGGASRFFYCAKASRSERNAGLEGMEAKQSDESRKPENPGGNIPRNRGAKKVLNNHPTVKPLKLMEYLCRLTITPQGGRVLDPFAGSGTTGLACLSTGRDCTLIEQKSEYCEIIRKRVEAHQKKVLKDSDNVV